MEEDILDIRRIRIGRRKKSLAEVLVVFVDNDCRDRIFSYARNIADFHDEKSGKPTAGMRLDVPAYLGGFIGPYYSMARQ